MNIVLYRVVKSLTRSIELVGLRTGCVRDRVCLVVCRKKIPPKRDFSIRAIRNQGTTDSAVLKFLEMAITFNKKNLVTDLGELDRDAKRSVCAHTQDVYHLAVGHLQEKRSLRFPNIQTVDSAFN
jgi:hypothetical protein